MRLLRPLWSIPNFRGNPQEGNPKFHTSYCNSSAYFPCSDCNSSHLPAKTWVCWSSHLFIWVPSLITLSWLLSWSFKGYEPWSCSLITSGSSLILGFLCIVFWSRSEPRKIAWPNRSRSLCEVAPLALGTLFLQEVSSFCPAELSGFWTDTRSNFCIVDFGW